MKRIHDEIDEVIGEDGQPRFTLREKLPFCRAFIKEIMRFRTTGPFAIVHCSNRDVKLCGYDIPKGTTILPNLYAVHNDPRNWNTPEEFNPDRHIDADGNINISKYLVPFGIGPRICTGRRLADMELFILFVSLFRRFNVIPTLKPDGKPHHVMDDAEVTGMSVRPPDRTPVTPVRRRSQ